MPKRSWINYLIVFVQNRLIKQIELDSTPNCNPDTHAAFCNGPQKMPYEVF